MLLNLNLKCTVAINRLNWLLAFSFSLLVCWIVKFDKRLWFTHVLSYYQQLACFTGLIITLECTASQNLMHTPTCSMTKINISQKKYAHINGDKKSIVRVQKDKTVFKSDLLYFLCHHPLKVHCYHPTIYTTVQLRVKPG